MTRAPMTTLSALVWLALAQAVLDAHRLDEYLQATRVAIDHDRVDLEIDLTPGVALAAQIFEAIDTDGNGVVSSEEARSYANGVIGQLTLDLDGHRAALSLSGDRFPTSAEMHQGVGTIRLQATTPITAPPGRHRLRVRNEHRPDIGVYLVNALVPASADIEITSQARDRLQHELRLEYRVLPAMWTSPLALTACAIVMIVALVTSRKAGPGGHQ